MEMGIPNSDAPLFRSICSHGLESQLCDGSKLSKGLLIDMLDYIFPHRERERVPKKS